MFGFSIYNIWPFSVRKQLEDERRRSARLEMKITNLTDILHAVAYGNIQYLYPVLKRTNFKSPNGKVSFSPHINKQLYFAGQVMNALGKRINDVGAYENINLQNTRGESAKNTDILYKEKVDEKL